MLFRFCLYGFLKNQQYYEPFIILSFLEKGLSFTTIGFLIGFRAICINILEVPTGAIADVLGRRRSMVLSFCAYIAAFIIFGLFSHLALLFLAMLMFSIGEAFRTGTHKALIFEWLAAEGRAGEKVKVYGLTRSWSKLGSALSALIAAALVFVTGNYSAIFLFSIVPYVVGIVNFMSYPSYLDGEKHESAHMSAIAVTFLHSLRDSFKNRQLRRLLAESMGFEGCYKVCKDYLQPLVKAFALSLPLFMALADHQRTAIVVGIVYCALNLMASHASRHSDSLARAAGSEQRGARWLWIMDVVAFAALTGGVIVGFPVVAVVSFLALGIIQNLWRPILISRIASHANKKRMATVLSMESQAKTLFAAIVAPILGFAVDMMPSSLSFLPVGLIGMAVAMIMLATSRNSKPD